jgi:hypothetical protein
MDMQPELLRNVRQSLSSAEAILQGVITKTVGEGEYGLARSATDAAEVIRKIRRQLDDRDGEPLERSSGLPQVPESPGATGGASVVKRVPRPRLPDSPSRHVKKMYPRFEVRQDTLYRYGWSKSEKQEYVHKVPRGVFLKTLEVMARLRQQSGGPFVAEEILKLVDSGDGGAPSYQLYVVLGLLREAGCIEQLGREGYRIPADISEKAETTWSDLSKRSDS